MRPKNKFLTAVGPVLFFIGALIGIIFFAGLIWPSLEANFYFGYNGGADTKLRVSCPRIITPADSAVVTATVTNKVDRPISPYYQTLISGPAIQTIQSKPVIEPGQTVDLKWDINEEDVAYGHLIMAQIYQHSTYKTLTAMGDCGSLYLFISGMTGNQVYTISFAATIILIITGIGLWRFGSGTLTGLGQERFSGMALLGGIILVGILLGTMGQWILGILALVLAILMFSIQIGHRLNPS
jgi:hypothetical protein